jgi:hypothetical protein
LLLKDDTIDLLIAIISRKAIPAANAATFRCRCGNGG